MRRPHPILLLGEISVETVRAVLGEENYIVGYAIEEPVGILVRSPRVPTRNFKKLEVVSRAGAGYNNITVKEATEDGVCVFNTPGQNANAVAEYVFGVLLNFARKIAPSVQYLRPFAGHTDIPLAEFVEKNKGQFLGFELRGRTLFVVGLGHVGVLVANLGIAFGMNVFGHDPYITADNAQLLDTRVRRVGAIDSVLPMADVVTVHVPFSPQTEGIIGGAQIERLRAGAILLNFSREGVYDDRAVMLAIKTQSGRVRHYITDFATDELVECTDVTVTPHQGGNTIESTTRCITMGAEQIRAFLEEGAVMKQGAVNFPALDLPPNPGSVQRLSVVNRDVPDMLGNITHFLGQAGINIAGMTNRSEGSIGYSLIDTDAPVPETLIAEIARIDGVLRTRVMEAAY